MPLEILDGALLVVRRSGFGPLLRALAAGAPLALCVVAIYYLERVEGVRSLRPLFALLLVLGFVLRSLRLSAVARGYALAIRPTLPLPEQPPRAIDIACTAAVLGMGLWVWLWPLSLLSLLSPWALAAGLPLLALRGAIAPSWLARSACARERGFAAFGQALDDTAGMRGVFLIVELLALFGTIALFTNLYAVVSFGLLLADSLLGLDVAFVATFLSPDNGFVLLLVGALALLLVEPLRAAIAAQAFVSARSRRDGADLHAAVDQVIAGAERRTRFGSGDVPPAAGAAALLLCAGCALALLPARVQAAPEQPATADAPAAEQVESEADALTRARLEQILARREFREFADSDSRAFGEWLERLLRSVDDFGAARSQAEASEPAQAARFSPFTVMAFALIAVCLIALYVASQRTAAGAQVASPSPLPAELPQAQSAASLLDDASLLAARGELRAALRALYVASLQTLDRHELIEYALHKTNGQYLRAMPAGVARTSFAAFTRIFDRTWYGHEPPSEGDYRTCRELAERMLSRDESASP